MPVRWAAREVAARTLHGVGALVRSGRVVDVDRLAEPAVPLGGV